MQRLATTDDEFYAVYVDRYNRQYRLTLAPNAHYVIQAWTLGLVESPEEANTVAQHFTACYNCAVDEGYKLELFPDVGPHFTFQGHNLLLDNALLPDVTPEKFRMFAQAVKETPQNSILGWPTT